MTTEDSFPRSPATATRQTFAQRTRGQEAASIVADAVFAAAYPFVRDTYEAFDQHGAPEVPTWKPGVRYEHVEPDDSEAVADAEGRILLTVVAVFKPGRFPTRVCFTRQWERPDGQRFGKNGLRIVTLEKFRRLARGYAHEYRVAGHRPARTLGMARADSPSETRGKDSTGQLSVETREGAKG